jgi:hypothetical protein
MQPPCLHLRVHAALIRSACSNDNGQILLPESVIHSTTKSSSIDESIDIDGKVENDPLTIRKEPSGLVHVFVNNCNPNSQTSIEQDNVLLEQTFKYSMPILLNHGLVLHPHGSRLKEFGDRARARLEQEKQKRKEIVVLDSLPEGKIEKKNKMMYSTSITAKHNDMSKRARLMPSRTPKTTQLSSSRSKKTHARDRSFRTLQQTTPPKTQSWTPKITHIPIPSGDKRSAFVKLHGLPIGCNADHIQKFFTGLTIERVCLLLNNRTAIPALDALNVASNHGSQNLMRVLVQFQSPSAATLAVDRSGETLSLNQLNLYAEKDIESPESPPATYVIGATQLTKDLATSLSRLTIEASAGATLETCLAATQSILPTYVREILWAQVHQECPIIPVDTETRQANILRVSAAATKTIDRMTLVEYQPLARHFNRLVELQQDLLSHLDGVAAHGLYLSGKDMSSCTNPVIRLTHEACRVLEIEMNRIDSMLYQVRVARRIHSHGSGPSGG